MVNKGYLDEKLLKMNSHITNTEKDYNELNLQYTKQSLAKVLIQRVVKTTIQIFYDKGLFDNCANAE